MSKIKVILISMLGASFFAIATGACAFGLPGFGKSSSPDLSKTTGMQTKLVKDFATGEVSILSAQANMAKALGNEKEAAELNASAKALQSPAALSKDDFNRIIRESKAAALEENNISEMASKMSAAGHTSMKNAVPEYLVGVAALTRLAPDYKSFMSSAESQISSASVMQIAQVKDKLSVGMFLASNGPGYVESLGDTTESFVKYAKGNNIKIPSDASALLPSSL